MCDTLVALGDATADGSTILAKNSDREANEAHEVVVVPAADHESDDMLRATHRHIPQARRTHAAVLAKPYWIWGAEMGVNDQGVAIGNEAVFTRAKREATPGLLGMDLLRLGLERGSTAEQAADVIVTHLRRYGQAGRAGHTHDLQYDNSYLIADAQEAWVLETVGRDWALQRASDTRSISNGLTIGTDADRCSPALSRPGVDVAADNSDLLYTRFSESEARQCRTGDGMAAAHGTLTPAAMMSLLRDHGPDGTSPGWSPSRGLLGMTVCAHAGFGPVRGGGSQSTGSMVAHLREPAATVWVTGTSAPCLSVPIPMWVDSGIDLGPAPGGRYDPRSWWWRHEDLHRATLRDYSTRAVFYSRQIADLEARFAAAAAAVADADRLTRAEFTAQCVRDVEQARQRWLAAALAIPVRRRNPAHYRWAWRSYDKAAHRPTYAPVGSPDLDAAVGESAAVAEEVPS